MSENKKYFDHEGFILSVFDREDKNKAPTTRDALTGGLVSKDTIGSIMGFGGIIEMCEDPHKKRSKKIKYFIKVSDAREITSLLDEAKRAHLANHGRTHCNPRIDSRIFEIHKVIDPITRQSAEGEIWLVQRK